MSGRGKGPHTDQSGVESGEAGGEFGFEELSGTRDWRARPSQANSAGSSMMDLFS